MKQNKFGWRSKGGKEAYAPKAILQAIVSSIVAIAIILGCAVLLNRDHFSKTFDLTTNKINSLSEESTKFLATLNKEVKVICVPSPSPTDTYCESNADLIQLYSRHSKYIQDEGGLNLSDQEAVEKLSPDGFGRIILLTDNNKSEVEGALTESRFTSALMNIVRAKKVVYFLTGSGEPTPSTNDSGRTYANVVQALRNKSYDVKEWNLKQGELPADAKLVVAGDNIVPYSKEVDTMMLRFLARGGRLLLVSNPYREQGLPELYRALRLKPADILLMLNPDTPLGRQVAKQNLARPPVVISDFNPASPITRVVSQVFGEQAVMLVDGGRPFAVIPDGGIPGVKAEHTALMASTGVVPVTLTPEQRNKLDLSRPLNLKADTDYDKTKKWAMAVDVKVDNASKMVAGVTPPEKVKDQSEVVMFGFSLVNEYSKEASITEELIPLTIAHLYQDEELLTIPPREFSPKQFNLSRNPMAWLPFFAAFLPFATAVAGFAIWMRRRSA